MSLAFAIFADGFWSAMAFRIVAGAGWAGTYMTGLRIIADPLEGTALSRAVSWHAAGVGISNATSFAIAGAVAAFALVNVGLVLPEVALNHRRHPRQVWADMQSQLPNYLAFGLPA